MREVSHDEVLRRLRLRFPPRLDAINIGARGDSLTEAGSNRVRTRLQQQDILAHVRDHSDIRFPRFRL